MPSEHADIVTEPLEPQTPWHLRLKGIQQRENSYINNVEEQKEQELLNGEVPTIALLCKCRVEA